MTSAADACEGTIGLRRCQLDPNRCSADLNSEIETTDSADFTDFEEVIGDERTNLFLAKLQGIDNRNLLYPCNLRNLWLNPFSVFGSNAARATLGVRQLRPGSTD